MNNQTNSVRNQLIGSGLVKQGGTTTVRSHAPRTFNDATLAQQQKNKQAAKRAIAILAATIHR